MTITNDWIAGFVDGHGRFNVDKRTTKGGAPATKYQFAVSQDRRSKDVLYALKEAFKCGTVRESGPDLFTFQVGDKGNIEKRVIPFFKKHPLQTEKRKDFDLFAEGLLTRQGAEGEEEKKFSFSINDGWFAGFVDAGGSFSVSIVKKSPRAQLLIAAPQEERALLSAMRDYLQCGRVQPRKDGLLAYRVSSAKDFQDHLFPKLFTRAGNPLLRTIKRISSQKFRKIVLLFLEGQHLTPPGLEKIVKLKADLNVASAGTCGDLVEDLQGQEEKV